MAIERETRSRSRNPEVLNFIVLNPKSHIEFHYGA